MRKPPYVIPTMKAIEAIEPNGLTVVSTFSGAGGSCLGYRMAGFTVLWANEFVDIAAKTYKLNHPNSIIDTRDIRKIQPQEILSATGKAEGEIDLFDGSPPCASFSTAGKREKGWGKTRKYSDRHQRVDDLFFEYARILKGLQPKVFVAENVSGLVKGKAKGYFIEILKALKGCGYRVKAKVLDAQWLGVPQSRARVIFIGVRNDLNREPAFPKPFAYRYSVRDALPWIVKAKYGKTWKPATHPSTTVSAQLAYNPETNTQGTEIVEAETDISRYAIGREWENLKQGESSDKYHQLTRLHLDKPSRCVTAEAGITHPLEKRKLSIAEVKRICSFPDDFQLIGKFSEQWERCGRAVPPLMMKAIASVIRDSILI